MEQTEFSFVLNSTGPDDEQISVAYIVTACDKRVAERIAQKDFEKRTGVKPRTCIFNAKNFDVADGPIEIFIPVEKEEEILQTMFRQNMMAMSANVSRSPDVSVQSQHAPATVPDTPSVEGGRHSASNRRQKDDAVPAKRKTRNKEDKRSGTGEKGKAASGGRHAARNSNAPSNDPKPDYSEDTTDDSIIEPPAKPKRTRTKRSKPEPPKQDVQEPPENPDTPTHGKHAASGPARSRKQRPENPEPSDKAKTQPEPVRRKPKPSKPNSRSSHQPNNRPQVSDDVAYQEFVDTVRTFPEDEAENNGQASEEINWISVKDVPHPMKGEDKTALVCTKSAFLGRVRLSHIARWNGKNWVCCGKKVSNVVYWAHLPKLPNLPI